VRGLCATNEALRAAAGGEVAGVAGGDRVTGRWVVYRRGANPLVLAKCARCGVESRPVADERLLTWWELLHECDDLLERLRRACGG
jgi:hypothetical protein